MTTAQVFAKKNPRFVQEQGQHSDSLRHILKYSRNNDVNADFVSEVFYKKLLALFNNEEINVQVMQSDFTDVNFCKLSRQEMDPIFKVLCKTQVFEDIEIIHDIGGGSGNFCEQFYKAYTKTAICLDLPANEKNFLRYNYKYLNTNKVLFESFDMFNDSWKELGSVFLSNIIHDYNETDVQILFNKFKNCENVFILEILRKEDDLLSACYDLMMRATLRSKQYSFEELDGFANSIGRSFKAVSDAVPFTLLKLD